MNKIAFLLCLLLALVGHLQHRLQSSFATIGRALFVALSCLVLVACGVPSLESREELARELAQLRVLVENEEYCKARIEGAPVMVRASIAVSDPPFFGSDLWTELNAIRAELHEIFALAREGCNLKADEARESKTWACAEGHSCR